MPAPEMHDMEFGVQLTVEHIRQWREQVEATLREHSTNLKSIIHGLEERLWELEPSPRFSAEVEDALQSDGMLSPGAATLALLNRRAQQRLNRPGETVEATRTRPGSGT